MTRDARTKAKRTPAEKKLADPLLIESVVHEPDPNAFARAAKYADAAEKSRHYERTRLRSTIDNLPIHYFHKIGESITGILGEPQGELWMASTYPLALDDGTVVRLPGNRRLMRAIQLAKCIGQRITIIYRGKLYRPGGHYEKIYRLEPAPWTLKEAEQAKERRVGEMVKHGLEKKAQAGQSEKKTADWIARAKKRIEDREAKKEGR
jgi:hypothetical protein